MVIAQKGNSFIKSHSLLHDFQQDYMSNYIDEGNIWGDIPAGWWLSNTSCFYCLAALVHHVNPDITEDPTTVEAGGTCVNQRKDLASERATAYATAKSAPGTVRGEMEESMLVTKATLMKKNIDLQETENIKEQLLLMEKFKSSFVNVSRSVAGDGVDGEMEYDRNVYNLLDELPFRKKMKASTEGDAADKAD